MTGRALGGPSAGAAAAPAAGPSAGPSAVRRRALARRWRWSFAVAAAACLVLYAVNALFFEIAPGNTWGLGYGIAAALLLVATALYGLRRRLPGLAARRRLGSARGWLYLHLYGGALFVLLMLMHSGFSVPTGAVTWWLWLLALWTVVSGLTGLALQQWIPRVLGSGLETEAVYERVPELVSEVGERAEAVAAGCDEPVRAVWERRLAPALGAPHRRLLYFFDITGGQPPGLRDLEYLRRLAAPEEAERIEELIRLYRTKLELDAHYTLQLGLRAWLWAHVPVSLVVLALLGVHLVTVWYY